MGNPTHLGAREGLQHQIPRMHTGKPHSWSASFLTRAAASRLLLFIMCLAELLTQEREELRRFLSV